MKKETYIVVSLLALSIAKGNFNSFLMQSNLRNLKNVQLLQDRYRISMMKKHVVSDDVTDVTLDLFNHRYQEDHVVSGGLEIILPFLTTSM